MSAYVSYERPLRYGIIDRVGATFQWDHIWFDYDDFTDLRVATDLPGQEPTYDFEADIYKFIFTLWY